jgi:O-antigen ligase
MSGPAPRTRFPSLAHALAGFFLLLHCNFPVSFNRVLIGTDTLQNPLFNGAYLVAVGLVWCHSTAFAFSARDWLRRNWVLLLVPALAVVSLLWSGNRPQTLHKSLMWLASTLTLLRICHQMGFRDFLRMLAWTLAFVNLVTLAVVLVFPETGTYTIPNVPYVMWRGLFSHKNYMGRVNLCSLIVFPMLIREKPLVWGFHSVIAGILLVGSRSGTNLGTAGILVLFEIGYRLLRQPWGQAHRRVLLGLFAGAALGGASLASHILELAGKDWTFSGRTVLFLQALIMIQRRPLLGYGFRAFWGSLDEGGGRLAREVQGALTWVTPHSHNSFLDLTLELGLAGLAAGCLLLLALHARARQAGQSGDPRLRAAGHFTQVILLWTLVSSLVETVLFINTFQWLLLVALGEYLSVTGLQPSASATPGSDNDTSAPADSASCTGRSPRPDACLPGFPPP